MCKLATRVDPRCVAGLPFQPPPFNVPAVPLSPSTLSISLPRLAQVDFHRRRLSQSINRNEEDSVADLFSFAGFPTARRVDRQDVRQPHLIFRLPAFYPPIIRLSFPSKRPTVRSAPYSCQRRPRAVRSAECCRGTCCRRKERRSIIE